LTDNNIRCEIQNEGASLSKSEQQQLFCKFTKLTAYKNKTSAGLGLYVARELMIAMNGDIWYESEIWQGITMEFPIEGN